MNNECVNIVKALRRKNLEELGKSIKRQRELWAVITNQKSKQPIIDELLVDLQNFSYGYRGSWSWWRRNGDNDY